ncbi:hypothetical protein AOQ84DRAFT_442470 [Glonium stellatum]|uniref:Uncharacterized protein n=1 Tax=Glonium stellatum TaxID=574774 RepID=A0A8E2ESD7_9PEZI|nr:hypothetical protein AOQ84DRAFT_442470 [Glonium stellatum]
MYFQYTKVAMVLVCTVLVGIATAQRPSNTSICDYYTETILGENTAANQKLLMVLLLHTTVLGNYTTPNVGIAVHGIATSGNFDGVEVNLLKYFTGEVASTNDGKTPHGVAINLLDDGGAAPLLKNMSSNGNTTSIQYNLFNHIEQYFATLLGCSKQGSSPELLTYQGRASMYQVHRYMDLSAAEMGFFIQQATLAIASLGFDPADVSYVNATLHTVFNYRCSPAQTLAPASAGPQLQACCTGPTCPLHPNATCAAYPDDGVAVPPAVVGNTTGGGGGNASVSRSAGAPTSTPSSLGVAVGAGGGAWVWGVLAAVVGIAVFAAGV